MRRREVLLLLLLSASMALAACGSLANLMAPRPWRTALIADSAPLPNAPPPVTPMTAAHSHNDYEQRRPLLDALALGYRSVEADIWLRDGELWVSHKGRSFAGTLRELYLDPLQARVDRLGSVGGDGEPFLLWLDLKSGEEELVLELRQLLARYPMLARMDGGKMKRAAVTVILTGDENGKRAYTAGAGARYACRDSNELLEDEKADPLHLWYALSWPDWFSWDGEGRIPSAERNRLRALVDAVQRLGRRLRLYHLPEAEGVWSEALDAGVDLLSTDELQRLEQFLDARSRRTRRSAEQRAELPVPPQRGGAHPEVPRHRPTAAPLVEPRPSRPEGYRYQIIRRRSPISMMNRRLSTCARPSSNSMYGHMPGISASSQLVDRPTLGSGPAASSHRASRTSAAGWG